MSYQGTVRRCLISGPGDVPEDDLAVVHKTINRWNGIYGEQYGTAVVPISWGTHAAAEFGQGAQAILNEQLVDSCDMCIAMFWTRLGTPTTEHESGSAEEIQRLSDKGKYVAVLRSRCELRPGFDLNQMGKLEQYLAKLERNALLLDYSNDAELGSHVDNILAWAVHRDQARSEDDLEDGGKYANVWPRIDVRERTRTNGHKKHRYLVLENVGGGTARDVKVDFNQTTAVLLGKSTTMFLKTLIAKTR